MVLYFIWKHKLYKHLPWSINKYFMSRYIWQMFSIQWVIPFPSTGFCYIQQFCLSTLSNFIFILIKCYFVLYPFALTTLFWSFIKRQASGTTSDNEWQRVTMTGTTSENEWQRVEQWVITNDNEWQRMTTSGTTNENEWQRVVERLTAKVLRRFQTYINHRVLFHYFLRRFPQIYLSKVTER